MFPRFMVFNMDLVLNVPEGAYFIRHVLKVIFSPHYFRLTRRQTKAILPLLLVT